MRILLLATLICLHTIVTAQDWVITTTQDSISGAINIEMATDNYEEIVVKNDAGKTRLKAHQFIEFNLDGQKYKTVKQAGKYRIMKVGKEGYLSLYFFRQDGAFDFGTQYLSKVTGDGILVPNISFKKGMSKFLADCSSIEQGFEQGKYKKSKLNELIDDYNNCIANNTVSLENESPEDNDNPLTLLIDSIKSKIDPSNSELQSLLNDIKSKIKQGNTVPGYLKSALTDQTAGMENIKAEVEELLNSI